MNHNRAKEKLVVDPVVDNHSNLAKVVATPTVEQKIYCDEAVWKVAPFENLQNSRSHIKWVSTHIHSI